MKLFVLGLALFQAPTASAPPAVQGPAAQAPGMQSSGSNAPNASAPADLESARPSVVLPEFDGLAEGLTALRLAVGEGKHDVALGLADALLAPNAWSRLRTGLESEHAWLRRGFDAVEPAVAWFGIGGPTSKARAEVHYAAGVAEDRGGDPAAAQTRFQTALALAGPGSLRLEAGYNVGAIALGLAERLREAQKQAPQPGAPGSPGAPGPQVAPGTRGSGIPGGEPLDQLESAYRAAKQELVLRLRADWHDEDTRANLELIQRRLREIEKQREQQKQQQEQQKQDSQQESKDKDPNQKDPQKSDPQQDQKDQKDQKDQPSSSNEERKDPSEQKDPKEGEPKDGEQQDPTQSDQEKPEQQPGEQQTDPKDAKDPKDAPPAKPEERVMTREEILRLLSQLEEIEKEGQAVRARLQRSRRASAEKDW